MVGVVDGNVNHLTAQDFLKMGQRPVEIVRTYSKKIKISGLSFLMNMMLLY